MVNCGHRVRNDLGVARVTPKLLTTVETHVHEHIHAPHGGGEGELFDDVTDLLRVGHDVHSVVPILPRASHIGIGWQQP